MLEWLNNDNLMLFIGKVGYVGVFSLVFLEMAFFFFFFLPGDSLLIIAGFLAAKSVLNLWVLMVGIVFFAFVGYIVAFWIGDLIGHRMLNWPDKWGYKKDYLLKSKAFFKKKGSIAIIIGRFVPIVRSFVPVVAGMSSMPKQRYMLCNIAGAVLWGAGLPLLGWLLSEIIPDPAKHLKTMVMVIIAISLLPVVLTYVRNYLSKRKGKDK